ncbi:MAG: hypothetical protein LBQ40_02590, partial [Clostridiales bacterium]|nr:hypothetical protein [Clostridiales bacterium]
MLWIASLALIIALAVVVSKYETVVGRNAAGDGVLTTLDDKAYRTKIESFAAYVKNAETGGFFRPAPRRLTRPIDKAYGLIRTKVERGEKIYEFEKWIYDNYYALNSRSGFSGLKKLRTVDGLPVIVGLARKIIYYSIDRLDFDRIKKGVLIYTSVNTLDVDDVLLLKEAFDYAVLAEISRVAARSLIIEKAKRAAQRQRIDGRLARSSSYLFFLFENRSKNREELRRYLERNDVDYANVNYIFGAGLAESNAGVAALISYLLGKDGFEPETLLTFSKLHSRLTADDIYKNSDTATKIAYLKKIAVLAKKTKKSQDSFLTGLIAGADIYKIYFGELLFYHSRELVLHVKSKKYVALKDNRKSAAAWYSSAVFLTAAILTAAFTLALKSLFVYILSPLILVVFLRTAYRLWNFILNRVKKDGVVFRMDYPDINDDSATLIVVSQFISSKEQFDDACRRADILKAADNSANAEYALLVDFAPSDGETDESDDGILEAVNSHGGLSFFVRKRKKVFGKFSADERKRGAVMALSKYLATGDGDDFRLIKDRGKKIKYVVLLDDDNELLPGSIRGLVNGIIHPLNKRYDLMTLCAKYNMYSIDTGYSRRFLSRSGVESYPYYSGLFCKLLGREIFCGKGIARVESLYGKLYGRLPRNRVLSHDIIEGAILDAGSSGIITFEDAPKNFAADVGRANRWAKGDLLLLPFLRRRIKDANGKKTALNISAFYKTVITVNAAGVIEAFCLMAALVAGFFAEVSAAFYCIILSAFFLDTLLNAAAGFFNGRKRTRYKLKECAAALIYAAADFCMTPFFAVNGLVVCIKTVYCLLFDKQNILRWKTFYASQKGLKSVAFLSYAAPSLTFMTLIAGAEFLIFGSLLWAFAALCYLSVFVVFSYGKGRSDRERTALRGGAADKFLLENAKKT